MAKSYKVKGAETHQETMCHKRWRNEKQLNKQRGRERGWGWGWVSTSRWKVRSKIQKKQEDVQAFIYNIAQKDFYFSE